MTSDVLCLLVGMFFGLIGIGMVVNGSKCFKSQHRCSGFIDTCVGVGYLIVAGVIIAAARILSESL